MSVKPWGDSRTGFIGASDAPTIVGVRTTPSRFRLWCEKRGELEPDPPNEAMEMGLWIEDSIAKAYWHRAGRQIVTGQYHAAHESLPWMRATIDGLDSKGDIVEFKLAGTWTTRKLPEDGDSAGLPEPWVIQLHHQMYVAGRDRAFLAAWCADPSFRLYEVKAEPDLMTAMVTMEEEFWNRVQLGEPPAEFGPDDLQAIKRHFRDKAPPIVIEDQMIQDYAAQYLLAKADMKMGEQEKEQAEAAILLRMGNATSAQCGPYLLKRNVVQIKETIAKPRPAHTQIRFTVSNGDQTDE